MLAPVLLSRSGACCRKKKGWADLKLDFTRLLKFFFKACTFSRRVSTLPFLNGTTTEIIFSKIQRVAKEIRDARRPWMPARPDLILYRTRLSGRHRPLTHQQEERERNR